MFTMLSTLSSVAYTVEINYHGKAFYLSSVLILNIRASHFNFVLACHGLVEKKRYSSDKRVTSAYSSGRVLQGHVRKLGSTVWYSCTKTLYFGY